MERINRSQHDEATLLPFSGLGISLTDVHTRATLCELAPVPKEIPIQIPQPTQVNALPACKGYGNGFAMLLAFGCEIRGR
ncbi:hypothetical protein [Halodesulfovibrio sp.]|uniref:hypothetical protein n=1 Tax=Halodesulfovibrio sp. TaxID=1912772 RepID=UPI0025E994A9|nr:hypothetical protein [Halodesulfovibrio sp.]MCT4535395.1 hypothetical protein [Halodesulfovibrio sp.]